MRSNLTGIDSAFQGNRKRIITFITIHLFTPFSIPNPGFIYFPPRRCRKALFCVVILLSTFSGYAQVTPAYCEAFEWQQLERLMVHARQDTVRVQAYNAMLKRLYRYERDQGRLRSFVIQMHNQLNVRQRDWKVAKQAIAARVSNKALLRHFGEKDAELIRQNRTLLTLIANRVLYYRLPHDYLNQELLCEEWAFYDLAPTQTVAEIGAGDGSFALLLSLAVPGIRVFAEDIETTWVEYMHDFAAELPVPTDGVQPVLGTATSPQLPELVDVIIIRNAYHHFDDIPAMLAAIRASLQPGGALYLLEYPASDVQSDYDCPRRMTEAELLRTFDEGGWTLVRQQPLGNGLLFLLRGE